MIHNKFEGDIRDLSPRQVEYISDILKKNGFGDSKVTIQSVGEAGDNYVANVKRLIAEKNGETFKMILKVAPKMEGLRENMNIGVMFLNENVMYTEVLPKFTELEKSAGIPVEEQLRYATCYGTLMEECDELILLEDLKESDFIMLDRFKSLTDVEVKLILKSFARLHSLSYVLKNHEPDTFDSFKNKLVDIFELMADNKATYQYFGMLEADCVFVLKEEKYKNIVKGSIGSWDSLRKKLNKFDCNSRFSVVQQGDSWTNNILFQFEENKAHSCCMIDYQISKISSPVADLHYMISNCTDYATRKQYFNDWIDYYHSELDKRLNEFGLKVNYTYPRDQLDADLKRHGKMGVSGAIILAVALSRESADAEKLKVAMAVTDDSNIEQMMANIKISAMGEKCVSVFRDRVKGVIDSYLEFGLL